MRGYITIEIYQKTIIKSPIDVNGMIEQQKRDAAEKGDVCILSFWTS